MTGGYLLDTNHVSRAITPGADLRQRIAERRKRGARIGTCLPVLCEIEAGLQGLRLADPYRANLERLLREVRVWPIERTTAKVYGEIFQDLRSRGRVLSQIDMMVAALAVQSSLTIVTADNDFAALAGLSIENWL